MDYELLKTLIKERTEQQNEILFGKKELVKLPELPINPLTKDYPVRHLEIVELIDKLDICLTNRELVRQIIEKTIDTVTYADIELPSFKENDEYIKYKEKLTEYNLAKTRQENGETYRLEPERDTITAFYELAVVKPVRNRSSHNYELFDPVLIIDTEQIALHNRFLFNPRLEVRESVVGNYLDVDIASYEEMSDQELENFLDDINWSEVMKALENSTSMYVRSIARKITHLYEERYPVTTTEEEEEEEEIKERSEFNRPFSEF